MKEYKYMNNFTVEVFTSLFSGIIIAIKDMKHYPKCRTVKVFSFSKL